MNILKKLGNSLEEIYLQREKIPGMWDRVTSFYAENIWCDLIDLGEKVHMMKKTHSPKNAIAATFFPRTLRNFSTFENEMEEFMNSFENTELKDADVKINGETTDFVLAEKVQTNSVATDFEGDAEPPEESYREALVNGFIKRSYNPKEDFIWEKKF